jgi:transmembrane sensor
LNEHPTIVEKYMGEQEWNEYKSSTRLHSVVSQKMLSVIRQSTYGKTKKSAWLRYVAAAVVLLVFISSAIYFLGNTNRRNNTDITKNNKLLEHKNDRLPGGDKALLTLADGSQIALDSAGNGILAQQGNTKITKNQDGQLIYTSTGPGTNEIAYNTLETPRGGQFKITLPDGSKVWLNAASSLKYPAAFIGNERKVEITGEAYFEIAKDVSKPFKVQLNQMEVEVLGTHFNINGYADEDVVRTTLLEGSVKINTKDRNNFLKPGQQAQLQKTGRIKLINDTDLEETMAWKDGNFQFENSDINTVMRQITRWYDVDIEYKGRVTKHFIGTISRNVNLSQVLTMLQQTGEVKFIIEGKKVVVMP